MDESLNLEGLAQARFGALSEAEIILLRAALSGGRAYCGPSDRDDDSENNPLGGETWSPTRHIRADIIRWLCLDPVVTNCIDPKGISIHGAQIRSGLDLSHAIVRFPLRFNRCYVADPLNLDYAQIPLIDLRGTHITSFTAVRSTIRGTAFLDFGFSADGQVELVGSTIEGNLSCEGGHFRNSASAESSSSPAAINAEAVRVRGGVLLRGGFEAKGAVRLYGAEIGQNLDCQDGIFLNPSIANNAATGMALNAEAVKVGGGVFFRGSFQAEGLVRLYDAVIGSNLDCEGGKFTNPFLADAPGSGVALHAEAVKVGGGALLRGGFEAKGMVRLYGAEIGSNLDCQDAKFINPFLADAPGSGIALNAEAVKVGGGILLRGGFEAKGLVRLYGAEIKSNLDCQDGKFINPFLPDAPVSGVALNAEAVTVGSGALFRGSFRAEGSVRLYGAEIGSNLDCQDGTFISPPVARVKDSGTALDAESAHIRGAALLRGTFVAEGTVRLYATQISGNLSCRGGSFRNPAKPDFPASGVALVAEAASIGGSVFLRDDFRADGLVSLFAATIGSNLECDSGHFHNRPLSTNKGLALDAANAKVGGSIFLRTGFSADGEVNLSAAHIGSYLNCNAGIFSNPPTKENEHSGIALRADAITVGRGVHLSRKFSAEGQVLASAASIGGTFDCRGAHITNPSRDDFKHSGVALDASAATIGGGLLLSDDFTAVGSVDLRYSNINGALYYQDATLPSLNLTDASARSIVDNEKSWPANGGLFLNGFVYGRIAGGPLEAHSRLRWLELQPEFNRQPYRQLAKVLYEGGDDVGSRRVASKMEAKAWAERRALIRHMGRVLQFTIGHGYFPLRAVWLLMALVIVGSLTYSLGYRSGSVVPTQKDAYVVFESGCFPPPEYERFHPLPYSLENSFPLVKLGIQEKWAPAPDMAINTCIPARIDSWPRRFFTSAKFLRYFRWIQISLGWVLTTLFVGGVTGILRKT